MYVHVHVVGAKSTTLCTEMQKRECANLRLMKKIGLVMAGPARVGATALCTYKYLYQPHVNRLARIRTTMYAIFSLI